MDYYVLEKKYYDLGVEIYGNKIFLSDAEKTRVFFHGTSVANAKKIIIDGFFIPVYCSFVYFTPKADYATVFASRTTKGIIFLCNLSNIKVCRYIEDYEYFVYGNVPKDVIEAILLVENREFKRFISEDELLKLEG